MEKDIINYVTYLLYFFACTISSTVASSLLLKFVDIRRVQVVTSLDLLASLQFDSLWFYAIWESVIHQHVTNF